MKVEILMLKTMVDAIRGGIADGLIFVWHRCARLVAPTPKMVPSRVTIRFMPASNGDLGCIDIIVEQGGLVLEHRKNIAMDLNHPSVPQSERDAAEKELQEWLDAD